MTSVTVHETGLNIIDCHNTVNRSIAEWLKRLWGQ